MIRAFHTSATGMNAQQIVLDNSANNLANINTTGFKGSLVDFQDMLYTTLRQPGSEASQGQFIPTGVQIGNGVRVAGNTRINTPGALALTGNSTDVAIDGDGFFQIEAAAGGTTRYTRDGNLRTNSNGDLVTIDGQFITPRITIPNNATGITIGNDGTVSVTTSGSTTSTPLGQIQIVRFVNPAGLSAVGNNQFEATSASGLATPTIPGQNGTGQLKGGFLENSNVQVVQEMVNMIQAQRAYEFNAKAIQVAEQMLQATNNLVQ